VTVAYDQFTGTTSGAALNARVAPLGGTWATAGATTDFTAVDIGSSELMTRTTTGDSGFRTAVLGATSYTNTEVMTDFSIGGNVYFTAGIATQGVIARYTDGSNFAWLEIGRSLTGHTFSLWRIASGAAVQIASASINAPFAFRLRLIVFASGRAVGQLLDTAGNVQTQITGFNSALATGGTLATGRPGFFESVNITVTGTYTRWFDNFYAATPQAEPIVLNGGQSIEFRHDGVIREDTGGTFYGRPPSYRGTRPVFPPGTGRVAVKARRTDLETSASDNVTDSTSVQLGVTPRFLVVPRS
jgi:hypothetical protein